MKSFFTLLLSIIVCISISAQRDFEPGYFIDDNDNKLKCLIQNEKWLFSPEEVFYKLNENSEVKSFTVKDCKEFRIGEEISFKLINTEIPIIQSKTNNRDDSPEPKLVKKRQFAQVLLEGKVPLYQVTNGEETVFLIENSNGQMEALLYKEYEENRLVKRNNIFKRQILKNFDCKSRLGIQSLKYTRKSMLSFFESLNVCMGDTDYKVYETKTKERLFSTIKMKLWGGIQQSRYKGKNFLTGLNLEFDNGISYRGGAELEAFISNKKPKKTSLFFGIVYSNIKNELQIPFDGLSESTLNLKIKALETSFGLRYYLKIANKSSVFLDAGILSNFYLNAELKETQVFTDIINRPPETDDFASISRKGDVVASFGIGYSFDKKTYLRFNYLINQNLVDNGTQIERDDLSQISLSLGYTL